ncbi:MAG: sigma-54-dependent Fis family transcriptional regulator [Geobacter sp.]|nr:sigma-54-dependent Fis family transcriptional regulator [Geobacter sp.]
MQARILIVDDEIQITRLISTVLGSDGHQTDVAYTCHDALTLIGQQSYDLIFIDIMLDKNQGGLALLKTATTLSPTSRVIMMTGYPDVATATESIRYGAFDYLCKPFDSLQISSITRHAIENRRLQLEREQFRANLEAINRSISDAIIMVDQHLHLQHLNDAALQCGYRTDQLGQPIDTLPTGCLGSCRMALAETVRTGQRQELKRIECRGNGSRTRIVSVIATPTTSEDGHRSGAVAVIRDETELDALERQLQQRSHFHTIIGRAPVMQQLFTRIEALADVTSTVLICGESGTGKELVAQALHECGARKQKPFIKLNCSALPEGLLESELFGHVRGAFTGAIKDKMGRFQKAHGGTIFLDEIGDISPSLQIRLLRVLQEREIERVGDTTPIKIDVRVIAATHRNLPEKVRRGEFRQDLYYRLNVVRLEVPPLRERLEDLPLLVEHFLHKFSHKFNRTFSSLSEDVLSALRNHSWPGNIRELEHLIEHACILSHSSIITSDDLPTEFFNTIGHRTETSHAQQPHATVDLQETLRRTQGNRTEAAKLLGISRRTFYRWLEQQTEP